MLCSIVQFVAARAAISSAVTLLSKACSSTWCVWMKSNFFSFV
jgi:hypothetical protein